MGTNKSTVALECMAPVTLFRSSMSDGAWHYICHKFQIPVDSDKVRSIKIESSESARDVINVTYEYVP